MKKLSILIALASLLFSGAAIAQVDHEPVRARDGSGADTFGVPKRLRENQDIQDCVGEYRAVREAFRQEMLKLRQNLANASEEEKLQIREQIREQLKTHLDEQREFRKSVRKVMRELRQERLGTGNRNATGNGNGG